MTTQSPATQRDFVELHTDVSHSPLWNKDLAPTTIKERTWSTWNIAALWIGMSVVITTYTLAGGFIEAGMNWWQAMITILMGNTIVLIPMILNAHAGTKYGVSFPVLSRAAFGTKGANIPAMLRAVVACGWFGIQAWIGGEALHTLFTAILPRWPTLLCGPIGGYPPTEWLSFLIFWGLNIFIIYRGMDLLRHVENWAAPFVLVMTALLLGWAIWKANGLGYLLTQQSKFHTLGDFWKIFIPSLTAMIGFWATLSLNMPDFTRFGRSQREQAIGQVAALPTTMTVFAAMGVIITSAAVVIYPHMKPEELWDPMKLVGQFQQVVVVAISMFTVVVATLAVNIAANVVSPANDFANAFPRWISFRTGGLITGILGIAMQPWKLLKDPSGYIFTWLGGYSGGLASIAGVLIIDYWLVRKKQLELGDLYRTRGTYKYTAGWNWRAVVATLLGCAVAWAGPLLARAGLVVPLLQMFYDYAWFVGFGASALSYWLLMKLSPPKMPQPQAV